MLVSFASQVLHSKSKTTVSPEVDPQEEEVLGGQAFLGVLSGPLYFSSGDLFL